MTANELADELENTYPFVGVMEVSAIMLRQQAKKIEDLLEHNAKLVDDLFAERKEVIRLEAEIEALKQRLELAEWDEDAWKKFKRDNYEVINLGDIKDDCK